jgi:hypothetical protein
MKTRAIIVCLMLLVGMPMSSAIAAGRDFTSEERAAADGQQASGSGQESYSQKGFYLGAGGTWAIQMFKNKIEDLTNQTVELGQTYGANAHMGFRALSWLSTGVEYEFLNGFEAKVAGKEALLFKGHTVTGDLKFHFIPKGPVQPNILLGFGGMKYTIKDQLGLGLTGGQWAFAARLGGGVDFYLSRHFLLNAEGSAVLTTNDITDPTSRESVTGLYYFSTQFNFQYRW